MRTLCLCLCGLLSVSTLLGSLGGCTAAQPTEAVSVLPTPTLRPTFTPTPTKVSPTATPQPKLEKGQRAQTNGDYGQAILEYGALLAAPNTTDEEARQAQLRLGESQLLAGEYESAIATLRDFLESHADDQAAPTAQFFLARACEGAGLWDEAIAAYRDYLEKRDIISPYVYERIGDIAMQKKDYQAAIDAYTAALNGTDDSSFIVHLRENIAGCYLEMKDFDRAVAEYDAILSIAKISSYRAKILRLAGIACKEWGQTEKARERFEQAVNSYPDTWDAYLSLVELVGAGVPVDEYQRGLVDYYSGAYGPAIQAFQRYLDSEPETRQGSARYYLALSYKATGQYSPAIDNFQVVIDKFVGHKNWADAWMEQAASWAMLGNVDEALSIYRRFAAENPDHAGAPDALWKGARWLEEAGRAADAIQAYTDLQHRYPGNEQAPKALLHAALNYYRLEDYDRAGQTLQTLLQEYGAAEEALASRFWLGKALWASGDKEGGKVELRRVVAQAPLDFYGLRAAMLLSATTTITTIQVIQTPSGAPTSTDPANPPDEKKEQAEAEKWLRTWITDTAKGPLGALPAALTESRQFRRAQELMAVGMRSEALEEYEKIRDSQVEDPGMAYTLAIAFRDAGAYRLSIGCAERLLRLAPGGHFKAPAFMQRLSYPTYYGDLIAPEAQAQGFDPWLYFALIRQESLFEAGADSSAGARGLAQIMPDTGADIANNTGNTGYKPDDLWKPYVSASFGAWYFARALQMFEGNPFAALAAYNAGPGNARRWYKIAPDDVDLFIEEIDLPETRHYVEAVYEQYAIYTYIYEDTSPSL